MLLIIASSVLLWICEASEPHCTERSTGSSGVIESLNYPNNFPKNYKCTSKISESLGKWIQINVTDVEILNKGGACYESYLNIRGLSYYCERNKPKDPLATNNEAIITFVGTGATGKGFSLRYKTISCTETRSDTSGEIVSPNYPFDYPYDVQCTWTIETKEDRRVRVEFLDFNIHNENNCTGDSLKLFDVKGKAEYLAGVYCGRMTPSTAYSKSNKFMVKFVTNNIAVRSGFRLKYSTVKFSDLPLVTPYPDPCNIELTAVQGIIKSPNYPRSPLTDRSCAWTIRRSKGEWIKYEFVDFDLNDRDSLMVTDDRDVLNPNLKTQNPFKPLATKNNAVITFTATGDNPRRGFLLSYTAISCNKEIYGGSGEIHSPNYPIRYPKNMECTWKIIAPPEKKVYAEFIEIDTLETTNCTYDAVKLLDVSVGKEYTFCGTIKPAPTVSTGTELVIKFQSKTQYPKRGFALKYDTDWFRSNVITPARPAPIRPIKPAWMRFDRL